MSAGRQTRVRQIWKAVKLYLFGTCKRREWRCSRAIFLEPNMTFQVSPEAEAQCNGVESNRSLFLLSIGRHNLNAGNCQCLIQPL